MSADLNSILMEALAGGQGMSAATTQALLSQLGEDDPTVSLLARYLTQRQSAEHEDETSSDEEEKTELASCSAELESARVRSTETALAVRRLREKVEEVYEELEVLRERNDLLAAALGACYLCWGEDSQCYVCAGEGRPGLGSPDRELFTRFVAPAVHSFQRRRGAERPFTREAVERTPSSNE